MKQREISVVDGLPQVNGKPVGLLRGPDLRIVAAEVILALAEAEAHIGWLEADLRRLVSWGYARHVEKPSPKTVISGEREIA